MTSEVKVTRAGHSAGKTRITTKRADELLAADLQGKQLRLDEKLNAAPGPGARRGKNPFSLHLHFQCTECVPRSCCERLSENREKRPFPASFVLADSPTIPLGYALLGFPRSTAARLLRSS